MKRIDWENELPDVPEKVHASVLAAIEGLSAENRELHTGGENMREDNNLKRKNVWGKKKTLALVAALAAVLGTTVVGAEILHWNDRAAEEFDHPASEVQEQMTAAGVAATPQASVTDAGVTVTAVQTIQDEYRLYILLEVTSEEAVLGTGGFDEMNLAADGQGTTPDVFNNVGWSFADQVTENSTHAYCWIDAMKDHDTAWNGESVTVTLGTLSYYTELDKGNGGVAHVVDGNWELTLPLSDASGLTRTWDLDTEVMLSGVPVTVRRVELSPLTLSISYDNEDVNELVKTVYGDAEEDIFISEMLMSELLDSDGNTIEKGHDAFGERIDTERGEYIWDVGLTSVVDPEKVGAILLGEDKVKVELP